MYLRTLIIVAPKRTLPDGRPYFRGSGANELNPDFGAGIYVIDNTDKGYKFQHYEPAAKNLGRLSTRRSGTASASAKNTLRSTDNRERSVCQSANQR
jgi:hypothetical protein